MRFRVSYLFRYLRKLINRDFLRVDLNLSDLSLASRSDLANQIA